MQKNLVVVGDVIDLRSDHLLAVINYALEQAATSHIEVLAFGDNEQALDHDEQLEYIKQMQSAVKSLVADSNKPLLVVAADEQTLKHYHSMLWLNDK